MASTASDIVLDNPTIETVENVRMTGLIARFALDEFYRIPALWNEFNRYFEPLAARGVPAYGISIAFSEDKGCTYMVAAKLSDFGPVPKGLEAFDIAAGTYAKFWQKGHISLMRPTIAAIMGRWLPNSGYEAGEAPMIEYYDESFDPVSGDGGYGLWLAVKKRG